jgi:ATP-dependent Clp protease ATP-binding subunit ClpA
VLDRFSDRARRSVQLAEDESRRLGHGHIGTEHLLLGLLAEGGSGAAKALVASGATLDGARIKVAEAVGDDHVGQNFQYTERAKRSLERAARLSLRRRDESVGTDHILLSVLDVEGRAGQVLRGLGVDIARLREAVDTPAVEEGPPAAAAPAVHQHEHASPRCGECGSELAEALMHRTLTSRGDDGSVRDAVVAYCSACGSAVGVLS